MKITIDYNDIKKLIEEAYNGVNNVTTQDEEMEILIDVDADKFSKKSKEHHNTIKPITVSGNLNTKDIIPKFEPGVKVDYETLMLQKEMLRDKELEQGKKLVSETHIPLVKTLEEKNEEARKKGLMTTGRGASRVIVKS